MLSEANSTRIFYVSKEGSCRVRAQGSRSRVVHVVASWSAQWPAPAEVRSTSTAHSGLMTHVQ
jgi:hypothetical protein